MKSKVIAMLIVFVAFCFCGVVMYSAGNEVESFVDSLATANGLDRESHVEEDKEEILTRYIATGYYANSVGDYGSVVISSVFNQLFLVCAVLFLTSIILAIFIVKNSNKNRQLGATR